MSTTISISLNVPASYGVEKLKRQLTEYARELIAAERPQTINDHIILTTEMLLSAQQAEKEYKDGQCMNQQAFNDRFDRWL
ncbi:MAG: hypothetical protein IJ209_01685 [Bacteroidaceae bacterium]|nr:hypothetical protein [Bacteroidaceae bacterium]